MSPTDRIPPPPPLRAVRTEAKCPVCGRPAAPKYRPFCAKRCADIDLGRWLKEGYRVPTDEAPEDAPGDGAEGRSGHGV
ncbi:MAG: DNA gyrase inhibitor YacG [Proteobacteria bacterium]|nr:DNA gyrase inhibitor YacG [Pseudomonadota bacterium]